MLPLLAALFAVGEVRRESPSQTTVWAPLVLLGGAALLALAAAGVAGKGELRQHLAPLFALDSLRADFALSATRPAALLSSLGCVLGLLGMWTSRGRMRAGHALLAAAFGLSFLADNLFLWLVAVDGGFAALVLLLPLESAPASRRVARMVVVSGVLRWVSVALLFFALGGSWSARGQGYLPDFNPAHRPPPVQARPTAGSGPAELLGFGPTLDLRTLRAQISLRMPDGKTPVVSSLHNKLLAGLRVSTLLAVGACGAVLLPLWAMLLLLGAARHQSLREPERLRSLAEQGVLFGFLVLHATQIVGFCRGVAR